MGIGFVIFIHLVVIFISASVLALASWGIASHFTDQEKRRQKIFFAAIAPYLGLYSFYFFVFVGSVIVSKIKGVDIGIGDFWYVPLSNQYQLQFSDSFDNSYLTNGNQDVISEIEQIQLVDKLVLGKTRNNLFFCVNTETEEIKHFTDKSTMVKYSKTPVNLNTVEKFYRTRKNDIAGIWFIITWAVSACISVGYLYLLRKVIIKYLNFR